MSRKPWDNWPFRQVLRDPPDEMSDYKQAIADYQAEMEKLIMAGAPSSILSGQGGGGPAGYGASAPVAAKVTTPLPLKHHSNEALAQMIATRMRYPTAKAMPFDHMHVVAVSEEKVIVLVVNGEQHAVLEDDGQFPSDTLINQLRLML